MAPGNRLRGAGTTIGKNLIGAVGFGLEPPSLKGDLLGLEKVPCQPLRLA